MPTQTPERAAEFDALVRDHKDAIYRQMVRMCGNADDAEDVLTEALLKAYRSLPQLEDDAAFRGWLAIIARRTCARLKKQEAVAPLVRLADLPGGGAERAAETLPPEQAVMEAETRACIHHVIDSLPDIYREVYRLSEVEERSAAEVAERLGISVAAVKSRLHRARHLVREGLDRELGCNT